MCCDNRLSCMQAKEAHEWIWYNIKDPNMFGLKPPRRWDPRGVQKPAPRPFYNRSDGHFLLNNSCTLVRLFLKPELRRLQCYFLPKLPKLIHPVCYHPPVPRVRQTNSYFLYIYWWMHLDLLVGRSRKKEIQMSNIAPNIIKGLTSRIFLWPHHVVNCKSHYGLINVLIIIFVNLRLSLASN